MKKFISFGVGITLLASPLIVSAQTVSISSSNNAALIATLTALVQALEQELQQLIAARGTPVTPPTNSPGNFTVSTMSGAAPLSVTFTTYLAPNYINFGDGVTSWVGGSSSAYTGTCTTTISGSCNYSTTHTYAEPGTYTATLQNDQNTLATATITVSSTATQSSVGFSASRTSGAAPLTTTFSGSFDTSQYGGEGSEFNINFGDSQIWPVNGHCFGSGSLCTFSTTHIYSSPGTYTASLVYDGNCSHIMGADCGYTSTIGTATVNVTGGGTVGILSISNDPSTPAFRSVASGGNQTLGIADLSLSDNEPAGISSITLQLASGKPTDLSSGQVIISNDSFPGAPQLGVATFTSAGGTATITLSSPLQIQPNTTLPLILQGNIAALSAGATAGDAVTVNIVGVQGKGLNSDAVVNSTGSTSFPGLQILNF